MAVADTHDLNTGKVNVAWSLMLNPTFPPENRRQARNTVDPNVRQTLRDLGFALEDDEAYDAFKEGWLWCLPVHIQWYGIPQAPVNCLVSEINPGVSGEAQPGEQYTGTASFKYFGTEPVANVPVGAFNGQWQAILKDAAGNVVTSTDFAPDEKKTFNFTWTAPGAGQTATLTGVINVNPLPDLFAETTKADNKASVTVHVEEPLMQQPQGSGSLAFQAVSTTDSQGRGGGEARAPNTAKWTDTVTATLTPDTPKPPRGSLTSWKIDWAKLTYPKKHPEFAFGAPEEPTGTLTINMSAGGHKSTAQFYQN